MKAALAAALALCACGAPCKDPDVTVVLTPELEDVRSLPILVSGKTQLPGLILDVPDSHGEIKIKVALTNAKAVTVTAMDYGTTVAGADKPVQINARRKGASDFGALGEVSTGDVLGYHWRTKEFTDLALPVAAAHVGKPSVAWKFQGCRVQTGTATVDVPGTIKAASSAKNFKLVGVEAIQPNPAKGVKVRMRLKSAVGEDVNSIGNYQYAITYFGEPGGFGVGYLKSENIAHQANGEPRSGISATETLEVYSSPTPQQQNAPYDFAGQSAITGLLSPRKGLLTLTLSSTAASASAPVTETFSELVDLVEP
jgi:hypothetical protein